MNHFTERPILRQGEIDCEKCRLAMAKRRPVETEKGYN